MSFEHSVLHSPAVATELCKLRVASTTVYRYRHLYFLCLYCSHRTWSCLSAVTRENYKLSAGSVHVYARHSLWSVFVVIGFNRKPSDVWWIKKYSTSTGSGLCIIKILVRSVKGLFINFSGGGGGGVAEYRGGGHSLFRQSMGGGGQEFFRQSESENLQI